MLRPRFRVMERDRKRAQGGKEPIQNVNAHKKPPNQAEIVRPVRIREAQAIRVSLNCS